jgi:hypothetical protein
VGDDATTSSISSTLLAAQPGDTVLVPPGRYPEQIRLSSGIAVISESLRAAVIVPDPTTPAPRVGVLADQVSGASFAGFSVEGSDSLPFGKGILVRRSEVELTDLHVSGADSAGIAIEGACAPGIRACLIRENPGPGITVGASARPRILHNLILRNGRRAPVPASGIVVEPGGDPLLVGNVIAGNGAYGVEGWTLERQAALIRANHFRADTLENTLDPVGLRGNLP